MFLLVISKSNILVRLLAIGIKFLSVILITRGLELNELDNYFLYVSIAAVFSPLFGLQTFHVVLRSYNKEKNLNIIDTQLYTYGLTSLLCIFIYFLLHQEINKYIYPNAFLLLLILFTEAIVLEVSRVLVVIGKSFSSNVVVLMNSLCYLLFGLSTIYNPSEGNVFSSWVIFLFLATFFACAILLFSLKSTAYVFFSQKFRLTECIKLVSDSKVYLLAQILNITVLYFSRFVLESNNRPGDLTLYSLLFAFSNIIGVFLTVGIIAPISPKYMANKSCDRKFLNKILLNVFLYGLTGILFLFLSFELFVLALNKNELLNYKFEFLILLIGFLLISLSQVYQLAFLKKNKDYVNLLSFSISASVGVFICVFYIPIAGILGACWALFFSALTLLIVRASVYYKSGIPK